MNATADQRLGYLWSSQTLAPYQRFGRCATCGCTEDEDGHRLYLTGVNSDSLVCLGCFLEEHAGRHPNYRRTGRKAAA